MDSHRAHRPKSIVVVGGQTVICESYDITINNKEEVNTCNITIPLDNIDSSIFGSRDPSDGVVGVQVWAGYITDDVDPDKQLVKIATEISKNGKSDLFDKRFDGYVVQPEWEFGQSRYLHLSCADWTNLLRETRLILTDRLEGANCSVKNIINLVQKRLKGIDIILDSDSGGVLLGQQQLVAPKKDANAKKGTNDKKSLLQVYNPGSKNLFEILQEVARELNLGIYVDGRTIRIATSYTKTDLWTMYYGDRDNQKDGKGIAIGQYFTDMRIRHGKKGRSSRPNLFVQVLGTNKDGKGAATKKVEVWYPNRADDYTGADTTQVIRIHMSGDVKPATAKKYAQDIYTRALKSVVTGSLTLPFANNFLKVGHVLTFLGDNLEAGKEIEFLKDIYFKIDSITESFSSEGYSQNVEFESDPILENSTTKPVAPKSKGKK